MRDSFKNSKSNIANYRLNYGLRNDLGIFDFNYSDILAIYNI